MTIPCNLQYQDAIAGEAPREVLALWRRAQMHVQHSWNRSVVASDHALGDAGLLGATGLRRFGKYLLVPMRDALGELWSTQSLPIAFRPGMPNCEQPALPLHGRVEGLHHWHGPMVDREAQDAYIGVTVHLHDAVCWHAETGVPVVVAFAPENLATLATMLCQAFPAAMVGVWARWPEHRDAAEHAANTSGAIAVTDCDAFGDAQGDAPCASSS